jgi:mono/diheme cytochrome c family protein
VILAASIAQKLGTVIALGLIIGWLIFMIAHLKRGTVRAGDEIRTAPNRKPYYDDDVLEGPKLERALTMALIFLIIIAIGLPVYWLNETRRENGAIKFLADQDVEIGFSLFQPATSTLPADAHLNELHFGCAGCHGSAKGPSDWGSKNFYPRAPQFIQEGSDVSPSEAFTAIHDGIRYSGMGAWRGQLKDEDIWKVADFVASQHGKNGSMKDMD